MNSWKDPALRYIPVTIALPVSYSPPTPVSDSARALIATWSRV